MAQANAAAGGGFATGREGVYGPPVGRCLRTESASLFLSRLDLLEALVITKTKAGFDSASVASLMQIVGDCLSGQLGPLKFLVFDFAHPDEAEAVGADGFDDLVGTVADMILTAPVVPVASARGFMAGADLELALACSMLIGEGGSRFSFAADPVASVGLYGSLAQKIGFVRAERLMEGGDVLSAAQMHELLLVKEVAGDGLGLAGIDRFLRSRARKHNSCYALYRAQRIALPSIYRRLSDAKLRPARQ